MVSITWGILSVMGNLYNMGSGETEAALPPTIIDGDVSPGIGGPSPLGIN